MKVLMTALLATAIQLSVTHAACAGKTGEDKISRSI